MAAMFNRKQISRYLEHLEKAATGPPGKEEVLKVNQNQKWKPRPLSHCIAKRWKMPQIESNLPISKHQNLPQSAIVSTKSIG